MFGLRNAAGQEQKTETEHASGFHSRETLYLNAFMLIYFLTFNTYKYAFPLFPFYSFDNDDMKSWKRHAVLLSLIFLLKCFSKSFFIIFPISNSSFFSVCVFCVEGVGCPARAY